MAYDVFISHSSKDKPTADAVCAVLEAQKIRCWVAPRDIIPGRDWGESIVEAIKGARVMVLIFSANANNSPQIKREVERAVNRGIPIIPLRIEDVVPTASLEYFLSTPHWLDAFTPPLDNHLQHLAQVIRQIVGVAPAETSSVSASSVGAVAPEKTEAQKAAPVRSGRFKPAWLAAAAAFVLLLGFGGWYFAVYQPEQQRSLILAERERVRLANTRGGLIVTTTPPGAEVAVGGFALEKSPVTLKDVKLSWYPVVIRLAGYEEERREVAVKENEFVTLDATLTRSTGTLNLASVPNELTVDVVGREGPDGAPLAAPQTVKTPATLKLPTGEYTLNFHRAGWPDQQQRVTVARNKAKPVLAEFVGGALEISSTPSGAEVFSQGKRLGTTPLSIPERIPSSFDLEFRLKGYKNATARGEVRMKETAQAAVVMEKIRGPEEGQAWTVPDLNLEMAYIQPETFTMGSENGDSDEKPLTRVTLTQGYWLGKTEVTQAQWEALMGSNPSYSTRADLPVARVSWEETMEFCRKLTERERSAGRLPEGYAYTLPTEAQWEYACRAGTSEDYAGNLDEMAWYRQNSGNTTHPVGQKQANVWGLYDMHGNVWEWCRDWYGSYPGVWVRDPTGPSSGSKRVNRGGCWSDTARDCRSSNRDGNGPGDRGDDLGFRLALGSVR